MALQDDKIKDLFASKLNSFEPEVPASVWGGLDQLLSQQPPIQAPDASSSSANATASSSAIKTTLIAVGVAAGVATGVFLAYDTQDAELPTAVEEVISEKIISIPAEEILEVEETTKVLAPADFVAAKAKVSTTVDEAPKEEKVGIADVAEKLEVTAKPEVFTLDEVEELPPAIELPKFFKEDLSLSLKSNAGALSSNMNQQGGDLLFSRDGRSTEFLDALANENKDYKLTHKQPISVGITVSKRLTRKFSIETGLMFTYLSSKITSNSISNIKEEQTFGYLGIPIFVNYNFYRLGKADFYLSLGLMAQKDVYGKYTSRVHNNPISINGDLQDPTFLQILYAEPAYMKKNISQSNWQLSSHFSVGVSYPIYNKLNIYTSVGGAYYFDAGNEYRTIYSDREFQLDLNLGLRFDF